MYHCVFGRVISSATGIPNYIIFDARKHKQCLTTLQRGNIIIPAISLGTRMQYSGNTRAILEDL